MSRLHFSLWILKAWTAFIYLLCPRLFLPRRAHFLAGHWYLNSVLIIGRETRGLCAVMRFPHIVGFQQCQLFDTFSGHSAMNEIQMKPIAYLGRRVSIKWRTRAREAESFWEIWPLWSAGLERPHVIMEKSLCPRIMQLSIGARTGLYDGEEMQKFQGKNCLFRPIGEYAMCAEMANIIIYQLSPGS